ncbi:adenylate/guanylate cyclase domain-containing protein [Agreia sp. VKM Ac-1783]|uniref:ATP-binding protein n=1 Tax=Agreia sp. VKM Ac-1783 TaxID=1938889 RepID=UPI0014838907|nr:adenylate/guanylate cyclase domain-containing protein [Agreia sp. VKM Ac-1783]
MWSHADSGSSDPAASPARATSPASGARICASCATRSTDAANFCSQCGAALPSDPQTPRAERRYTSILFADLVGFTELAERTDAEDIRELLSEYFALCRRTIESLGGVVEKFIGDAVMAVWGATRTREDDAERAVRAALELTRAVGDYGRASGFGGLAVRIGIVTDEVAVVLGAAGEGMVAGTAVNLAARLQAAAAPATVLTDSHTRTLTVERIDFGREKRVAVKGIAEEVPAYQALRVISETGSGAAPAAEILTTLVGRDAERDVLIASFDRVVATGRPQVAVVSADAGVGKSRLVLELRDHLDYVPMAIMWHSARCLSYGEGVAYSALSSAVRSRIGAVEGESQAVAIGRLRTKLASWASAGEAASADLDWMSERLAPLLSAGAESAPLLSSGSAGYGRDEFFAAWSLWFERMSAGENAPVVWVIEDAQWADDGLLDFVRHLQRTVPAPVLIVIVTRPELLDRRPDVGAWENTTVLDLGPLDDESIVALIAGLAPELPRDILRLLSTRVGGVPLYARELLRSLVDDGLLQNTDGGLRLAPGVTADTLAVAEPPASLRVLIASRLDSLEAGARLVAQLASVLGFSFSMPALAAVSKRPVHDLAGDVSTLETRGIVISITDPLSSERGHYVFSHPLIRQVAYEMQSRKSRSERHLATVDFLESSPDEGSRSAAVIAQHLVDALQLQTAPSASTEPAARRAVHWLLAAADSARRLGAATAARRLYEQAIDVWPLANPAGRDADGRTVRDLEELAREVASTSVTG